MIYDVKWRLQSKVLGFILSRKTDVLYHTQLHTQHEHGALRNASRPSKYRIPYFVKTNTQHYWTVSPFIYDTTFKHGTSVRKQIILDGHPNTRFDVIQSLQRIQHQNQPCNISILWNKTARDLRSS
jgi:hypothetical protein